MHLSTEDIPRIAVVSTDLRAADKVIRGLKKRGLKFVHISTLDQVPAYVNVLISDRRGENPKSGLSTLFYGDFPSPTAMVDKALELSHGKEECKSATVSIDPGKRIGAAFFCDDLLLRTETYHSKKALVKAVESFLKHHKCGDMRVVVGSGAPDHRRALMSSLKNLGMDGLKIFLADEKSSRRNLFLPSSLSRDESSAVTISTRQRRKA